MGTRRPQNIKLSLSGRLEVGQEETESGVSGTGLWGTGNVTTCSKGAEWAKQATEGETRFWDREQRLGVGPHRGQARLFQLLQAAHVARQQRLRSGPGQLGIDRQHLPRGGSEGPGHLVHFAPVAREVVGRATAKVLAVASAAGGGSEATLPGPSPASAT